MSLARQFAADDHRKYRLPVALSLSLLASLPAAAEPRVTVSATRWHARSELSLANAGLRAVFAEAEESLRLSSVRLKHRGREFLLLEACAPVLPRAPEAVDSVARRPDGFAIRRDLPEPDESRAVFWKPSAGVRLTGDAAELVMTETIRVRRDGGFRGEAFRIDLTPARPLRIGGDRTGRMAPRPCPRPGNTAVRDKPWPWRVKTAGCCWN